MKKSIFLTLIAFCIVSTVGCLPNFNTGNSSSGIVDDYQFSIMLLEFSRNDMHANQAQKAAEYWTRATGWDEIFAVGDETYSRVCVGKFKTLREAHAALEKVRAFSYNSNHPFARSVAIPMPGANVGPPEFDLKKTTEGYYTAVVAIFYNDPESGITDRKGQAVYTCTELNKEFEALRSKPGMENIYKAFYYHGPQKSMVTIGLFPETAITYKHQKIRIAGQSRESYQTVAVYKNKTLANLILKKYPELVVNGLYDRMDLPSIDPKTGKAVYAKTGTYAIIIPGRKKIEVEKAPSSRSRNNNNRNRRPGLPDISGF